MTKQAPQKRVAPRRYAVKTFTLPFVLVAEIEKLADLDYGGNQSALVTATLAGSLGVNLPDEHPMKEPA